MPAKDTKGGGDGGENTLWEGDDEESISYISSLFFLGN